MKFRKLIGILLALLISMQITSPVQAEEEIPISPIHISRFAATNYQSTNWLNGYDSDDLKEDLFNQFYNYNTKIDVSKYKITTSNINSLISFIQHDIVEAFQIDFDNGYYTSSDSKISTLRFSYLFTQNEYLQKLAEVRSAARSMIADLKALPTEQQALLLHDRIALNCSYQVAPYLANDYTIYGVFGEKTAVCQGYALAYRYALDMLQIENEMCISQALNHAWNIVTIDGEQYHVDITWDDSVDRPGRVTHKNFLRSTEGMIETGHTASDYNTTPSNTKYDSYFWSNCKAAFIKLRNEIYYIDPDTSAIRRYSDGKTIITLTTRWPTTNGYYYSGCYSMLASDGAYLLYSETDSIYRYDPVANKTQKVYTIDENYDTVMNVYAFALDGSTLNCGLSSSPNFKTATDVIDYIALPYELPTPFTTADAVTIMKYLIGVNLSIDWAIMDRNLDDTITITDAVLMLRALTN